ncbi:hypothetical protein [Litoreibacter roseus]|uniref:hypothetical protein n=1 Tax=Litoreibacter roseus TaxID=2601869 RepID=UPI0013591136|nr:hypothetical protein [Litoreibacter roseus]
MNRLTGGSDAIVPTRNTPGVGHLQFATMLRVDTLTHTTAELTWMKFARLSDDD